MAGFDDTALCPDNELSELGVQRDRLHSRAPNPVDKYVGSRVRHRRMLLGLSQEQLGAALGISFQQVQKYEQGDNRIGASRLFELACLLDVQVAYFYDDMPEEISGKPKNDSAVSGFRDPAASFEAAPLGKRDTFEMARAFCRIDDPGMRQLLLNLGKSFVARLEQNRSADS